MVELRAKRDDLAIKMTDFDKYRIEAERLKQVELDNRSLRDWRRDHEAKVATLTDRNVDLERTILGLRNQIAENDALMTKFAEELRQMDVEIDRKQRDQDNLDRRNQNLAKELELYKEKEARYN